MPSNWTQYEKLVLEDLRRINETIKSIDGKLDSQGTEIERLKIKSGLWGTIGGALSFVVMYIIQAMKN